jgi:hypothetical protein
MSYTSDLVFLGPAIGAVITSVYALRQARVSTAVQLHTAHVDKRLDVANLFMDTVDRCRECRDPKVLPARARAVQSAHLRVRLALADCGARQVAHREHGRRTERQDLCPNEPAPAPLARATDPPRGRRWASRTPSSAPARLGNAVP